MARGGLTKGTEGEKKKALPVDAKKKISKKTSTSGAAKGSDVNHAGLHVSVARMNKRMKMDFRKTSSNAKVAFCAFVEDTLIELLESAAEEAVLDNRKTILPQDIERCIQLDVDFSKVFKNYKISGTSGVNVKIDRELVPKRLLDRRDKSEAKRQLALESS